MATELQMAVINRYISKAPETLEELQEYVDTCAAINKDRNGDIYWIIGLIIRLLPQAATTADAPVKPEVQPADSGDKDQTVSNDNGTLTAPDGDGKTTIGEPAKTDEAEEPEVIKGIRYTKEGDQVRAVYDASFVNLEESPSGLGKTPAAAFEALNAEREKRNADAATKAKAGDNAKTE